jgi:hypothetical protein
MVRRRQENRNLTQHEARFVRMRFAVAVALFALALIEAPPADGAGLALVFAVDVSRSVTAESYRLQHDGIARAIENPALINAIIALGGIEALVLEWSDPDKIAVTVGWARISNARDAGRFAARVRASRRSSHGLTSIGSALLAAAAAFERLPEPAARHVIDISGDGMANFGPEPGPVRDALVARGITINGLAILTEEPWLASYYRRYVIGGAGAFVLIAKDFGSFADAMLKKLVAEVALFDAVRRMPDRKGGCGTPTAQPNI